jgi:hypothetical protein
MASFIVHCSLSEVYLIHTAFPYSTLLLFTCYWLPSYKFILRLAVTFDNTEYKVRYVNTIERSRVQPLPLIFKQKKNVSIVGANNLKTGEEQTSGPLCNYIKQTYV